VLEPEHLIGRSPVCTLVLEEACVSSQHAVVRWMGDVWELRDLASRNGTFIDGVRLQSPDAKRLVRRSVVAFGQEHVAWEVLDDTPPQVMAVPLAGGEPVLMEGDLLPLPSDEEPLVTLYRGQDGTWRAEWPDQATEIVHNGQTMEIGGRSWRFWCPESLARTAVPDQSEPPSRVRMKFSVSRDEEHVALQVDSGGKAYDLGTRGHNYLLLTLARHRLEDRERGLPETSCGWIYQDELLDALDVTAQQLNIDVFRIRKQFAEIGVRDPASIVERRPRTRQLRLGTPMIEIAQI
jgi:hypothetical protein